jgi:hypothetical protein
VRYLSLFAFIVGTVIICLCMAGWLPRARQSSVIEAVNQSLNSGKYLGVLLLFLGAVVDAILGPGTSRRHPIGRLLLFSTALLLAVLSIADLKFGSVLGMTESPWMSYRNAIAMAIQHNEAPPAGVPDTPDMQQARAKWSQGLRRFDRPSFAFAYTGAIALSVLAANGFFLFMSLLLTRQVLGDLHNPVSWSARLGSILVLAAGSIVYALACTIAVGVLCNPAIWVVVILAAAMKSTTVFIVGTAFALIFEWWVSGPWFKVLVVVALLPALCATVLSGGDWIDNALRMSIAKFGQVAIAPMLARRGEIVIPIVATALILLLATLLIWRLP